MLASRQIPFVRLGGRVRIPVVAWDAWIAELAEEARRNASEVQDIADSSKAA
jgi:hypothetical protein